MPETILIVDDASNHSRRIEYVIGQKLGYHVLTTASSEEAGQWVLSNRQPQPDLLLLDLAMPDNSGLQLIHEIKSSCPQLPVIALVPYGDDGCAMQVVKAGVNDFLTKPVMLDRLGLSLRNTLALKRMGNAILRLIEQWQPVYYKDSVTAVSAASSLLFDKSGKIKKLKSIEEDIIRLALQHNNGCMTRAARQLGIGRSTLYRRVGDLGIEVQKSAEKMVTG